MVEMILVLPVLVLMLFSIAQFGLLFQRWLTLSNAVREGARELVVYREVCDAGTVETEVKQTVSDYADTGGITLADGDITVTGECVAGGDGTVHAEFPFVVSVPYLGDPYSIDLVYESTMRNE